MNLHQYLSPGTHSLSHSPNDSLFQSDFGDFGIPCFIDCLSLSMATWQASVSLSLLCSLTACCTQRVNSDHPWFADRGPCSWRWISRWPSRRNVLLRYLPSDFDIVQVLGGKFQFFWIANSGWAGESERPVRYPSVHSVLHWGIPCNSTSGRGLQDYDVLERLGEGAFGKVYKARHKKTEDCRQKWSVSSFDLMWFD